MKFCPNCGSVLENKTICDCGYNIKTKEVDENTYIEYKNKEKENYFRSSDNIMGINPNTEQVIFNKDNDNLKSEDIRIILERDKKHEE